MKKADADKLMEFLDAAFPKLEVEQIALYSRLLESETDVELVSRAILKLVTTWKHLSPPSYADIKEYIRIEKKLSEPDKPYEHKGPISTPKVMPNWVRRFVCARFLYARFGREPDWRDFPEQHPYGAPAGIELMPEDEWTEEAATVNLTDAWRAIRSVTTGGNV